MSTIHHFSAFWRTATMILLTLAVLGLWATPALAQEGCDTPCNDPIADEIHTPPVGMLTSPPIPAPIPGICACPTEGCDSLFVYFTDYSTGYIDTWEWDFGDPASGSDNYSNEENPTHLYRAPGTYTVTLTITGPGGTASKTRSDFITIRTSPKADFTSTIEEGCTSTTVHFTDLSTGGPTWWYRWDFGDGSPRVYERNPSHTYTASGTYNVALKVMNTCGRDSVTKEVTIVVGAPPTADFSTDLTSGCVGAMVTFTDHSLLAESWSWSFGDGTTSTEQHPTHAYTLPGVYTISLTVTNECGSDDTSRVECITIRPLPVASFTSNTTEVCTGGMVNFTDQSQFATSWLWDFGDGGSSTEQNPAHTYSAPGLYSVILTVANDCGQGIASHENYISVVTEPVADFSASETNTCAGAQITFTDHSLNATTWHWDFGDGTSSLEQNPSHAYTLGGVYTVTLAIANACGEDSETKSAYIVVAPWPVADFTADKTDICTGQSVTFTDLSPDATSWHWDFGDGATSTVQNPTHTYTSAGFFTVALAVVNECGQDEEIRRRYIGVMDTPVADFESNTRQICENTPVAFTDLSEYATEWLWNFGDGDSSTAQNPSHTYTTAGTYAVTLTVKNSCGQDTEFRQEYITVVALPVADFYASATNTCVGTVIGFISTSANADSWLWDFGDGTTSTDSIAPHTYSQPGTYTITLTVTNGCGSDSRTREQYVIVSAPPIADFGYESSGGCDAGHVVVYDRSINAASWLWNFGDGTTSTQSYPGEHVYTAEGDYTITLTVGNSCGYDTTSRPVHVDALMTPVADFTADLTSTCVGGAVAFTDLSSAAASWAWTFGDGATSTERNPVHAYSTAGTYTVSLTISNECGEDTETKAEYITVSAAPVADFVSEMTHGCVGAEIAFSDRSSNATSWSWTFGDGATSTERNPVHAYTAAGVYSVALTATNSCGQDVETKTEYVTIAAGPHADFSATPRSGLAPLAVNFTDLSTSALGITSWSWTFGDGGTSTDQNPSHTYTAPGVYTVELRVTDDCGLDVARKSEYISVTHECSVDFTAEPISGCAPLTVLFDGTYTGTCEISSWTWDFGDPASGTANSGSGQHIQHVYASSGTYSITLTATDISGVKVVTKTNYVEVSGVPTAAFEATPTGGASPLFVNFTDLSTGTVDSYEWNFGDPTSGSDNTSSLPSPNHTYESEGVYTVSLIVTNTCGADTAFTEINVSSLITIVKAVDRATAPLGAELLYTLTVRNTSDATIYGMHVADTVPDSTTLVTGSITGGGAFASGENTVNWTIATLSAGSDVTLTFRVLIDGEFTQFPAVISNYAVATIPDIATFRSSVRTFVSNTVETIVDEPTGELGIVKAVSVTLASPGDRLTYTITVTNNNPSRATAVAVFDAIPDSTTYVAGSASGGGRYNAATDSLFWNLGSIDAFESQAVSFEVTIDTLIGGEGLKIPNTALVRSSLGGNESNEVVTTVNLTPIVVTKTAGRSGGTTGDLIRFTITVQNYSPDLFTDVRLIDTLPGGMLYVPETSVLDGKAVVDPSGDNPYEWSLGNLRAGGTFTLEYTALIGASAHPGVNDNVARARAYQSGVLIHSNRAIAQIHVVTYALSGSIRGRVSVDCDGDGIADLDAGPTGMDVYLDDGSQSRVNKAGMFYFSTVSAGEHVVALDERDLDGWYVPEGAQASVFVHVQETGESYVTFRLCPEYPRLNVLKSASIVPTVTITKTATFNVEKSDTLGALIDYQIAITSNGLAAPTPLRLIDSLPSNTRLALPEQQSLAPIQNGDQLLYELSAALEPIRQSVWYSLRDLTPGERRFLTNKAHLEADVDNGNGQLALTISTPAEVTAGPLILAPSKDVMVTLTPALFITSKADLLPAAIPQLQIVADSIDKYADANIKVEGHTDHRPIHTKEFPSNWELGEARAKAVVDWLVANRGIARERLSYESFAATRPVVQTGKTSEQLQPNRRTEVIIKARLAGLMDTSALVNKTWKNSTTLPLKPARFDTLFERAAGPTDTGLSDSWEIVLTVQNTGIIAADNVVLSDILPDGSEYVANSAMLDGRSAAVTVDGRTLKLTLTRVEPSQKLELRYRISALQGQTPTGGGAASVQMITGENLPVLQTSNDVRFR